MSKDVSSSTFVWAHVAVIIFHVLVAVLLIISQRRAKVGGYASKSVVVFLGYLLLAVSLLGLVPILQEKDYTIA